MPCLPSHYRAGAFWADDALASLRERFPRWDIWYVLCFPNQVVWCAKPAGSPVSTVERSHPDLLAAALEVAEADEALADRMLGGHPVKGL